MKIALLLIATLGLWSAGASAEVKEARADGFLIAFEAPLNATPAKAYADIAQVQQWWSDEQTWSGNAANLTLVASAGGCFCERWKDGSAEHGRVVMALKDRLVRIDTALGPLHELALNGVLSFWINTGDDGAGAISVEYRVNGASASGLDVLAPQVDQLLDVQVARLVRYIDTGIADAPVAAPQHPSADDTRAALLKAWATQATAEQPVDSGRPKTKRKPSKKP